MGNPYVGTCVECAKLKPLATHTGLCAKCTKDASSDPQPKKENSNGS